MHHIQGQLVAGDVHGTFFELQCHSDRVRHYRKPHPLDLRRTGPIVCIALDDNFLVLLRRYEPERARTNRRQSKVLSRALRHHAEQAVAQVEEQGSVRSVHPDRDRQPIPRLGPQYPCKRPRLACHQRAVNKGIDGVGYIVGGQRTTVLKAHAIAEVKHPGERVRLLPAGREPRLHLEVLVLLDQRVEEEAADALGHSIRAYAWVERVGRILDRDDDGARVVSRGLATNQRHQCQQQNTNPSRSFAQTSRP